MDQDWNVKGLEAEAVRRGGKMRGRDDFITRITTDLKTQNCEQHITSNILFLLSSPPFHPFPPPRQTKPLQKKPGQRRSFCIATAAPPGTRCLPHPHPPLPLLQETRSGRWNSRSQTCRSDTGVSTLACAEGKPDGAAAPPLRLPAAPGRPASTLLPGMD